MTEHARSGRADGGGWGLLGVLLVAPLLAFLVPCTATYELLRLVA